MNPNARATLLLAASTLLATASHAAPPGGRELTEAEAAAVVVGSAEAARAYGLEAGCLAARTVEYRNAGYTIDLLAGTCSGARPGALLGRWRVDSSTGELFVRNEKGKFVRPVPSARGTAGNEPSAATIREERTVVVNGVSERWRLEWAGRTEPVCAPESGWDEWVLCPCAGFEFAEDGDLDLVRARPGTPEERLRLTPFFQGGDAPGGKAVLRRWPVENGDEEASRRPGFPARVRSRPLAPAMVLADYDHDGGATEFVLQIGAIPCGHRQAIVVGVDPRNPRLHAFASIEAKGAPLVLESPEQWERLRKSPAGVTVRLWGCGDHGSDEEKTVRLRAARDGIHAQVSVKACP